MLKRSLSEKGQSLVEYAVLLPLALLTVYAILVILQLVPNPFKKHTTVALGTPRDGYSGIQSNPTCIPSGGYQACATTVVTYAVRSEDLVVEGHLTFAWNANGIEANAVGAATITLTYSEGTLQAQVISGDNLIGSNHEYQVVDITVPGFTCTARDATLNTWDCNR